MRYLTSRKRAEGLGSARAGTMHHITMNRTAWALLFLSPVVVFITGRAIGGSQEEVRAAFGHPVAAIAIGLFLVIGMRHFAKGMQTIVEDYTQGFTRTALVMIANAIAYLTIAAGLYALVRLAL